MLHFIGVKISDRIRAARTKAGLTQRALAARLGVDKSAVAQWEGGGGGVGIKTSNLVEVARVLGVRPSDLLGEPSHADRLVLEDTDEITLVTLFRGLPKALREAHLRLLYVSSDPGNVAQLSSHEPDRRQLVS
jgi:transcriptional regulator with XRE-family HTH domain